jgi:hypothetical protein
VAQSDAKESWKELIGVCLATTKMTSQKELAKKLEDADLAKCRHATPCPTMVVVVMMQKDLHNNKNGRKQNLNKPCHMTYKNTYSNVKLDSTSKYYNKKKQS